MKNIFTKLFKVGGFIVLLLGIMNNASFAEEFIKAYEKSDGLLVVNFQTNNNANILKNKTTVTLTIKSNYRTKTIVKEYKLGITAENVWDYIKVNDFYPGESLNVKAEIYYWRSNNLGGYYYTSTVQTNLVLGYPKVYIQNSSDCYSDKIKISVRDAGYRGLQYATLKLYRHDNSGHRTFITNLTTSNIEKDGGYDFYYYHTGLSENETVNYDVKVICPSRLSGKIKSKTYWPHVSTYISSYADKVDLWERGHTYDMNLRASKDESDRIIIEWDEPCHDEVTGYELKRYKNGVYDYMTFSPPNREQRNYSDETKLTPGYNYEYRLTTIPEGYNNDKAIGRIIPDGWIKGRITTTIGDGVKGVKVVAKRQGTVESDTTSVYYGITDDEGYYVIDEIFYNTSSEFTVYPVMALHEFNPVERKEVTLTTSDHNIENVNFEDISSFSVKGNIKQKTPKGNCILSGVNILVNGLDQGVITNDQGDFTITIPVAGEYKIKPELESHLFTPDSIVLNVDNNVSGIMFTDTTTFQLEGYVTASCENYIGQAGLRITDLAACYDTLVQTRELDGYYAVNLPARKYSIEVESFTSVDESIIASQDVLDYFLKDTIDVSTNDTTYNATFRLRPELAIEPEGFSSACGEIIMQQGKETNIVFNVTEKFNGQSCNTEDGYVVVTQNIDSEDLRRDTLAIENGTATLTIIPGEPKITGDFSKDLYVTAYVGNYTISDQRKVIVTGHSPRGATFTTVTPSLPFLILHDPPGDASYSYLEESTTVENAMSFSVAGEAGVNTWIEVKVGAKFEAGQFLLLETEMWASVNGSIEIGASHVENDELVYTMTNSETFSTSGGDVVGADGDVYVGGAMNLIYALTDIISYDYKNCVARKKTDLIVAPRGFSTTFIYTEEHINETLIPQLEEMAFFAEADGETTKANDYLNQAGVWKQMLEQNKENIKRAKFVENKSFSAGLSYESSVESSTSESMALEFGVYIDENVAVEAGCEVGGSGASGGVEVKVRADFGSSETTTVTKTHKTGYVLEDDDAGDFYSVDILTDPVYGTPAFRTKAGRSSCPHEENTQQRERLELSSNIYRQNLSSSSEVAVFELELTNLSGSSEKQTYNLMFDPTSNPGGAIITIGGSAVFGNVPTPFTIPPFQSVNAIVTVTKGPAATSYSGLKFTLESNCDGSVSDDVYLDVFYPSICSEMIISTKKEIITTDEIKLELSGYDLLLMDNFYVEACPVGGSTWTVLQQYDKTSLNGESSEINVPLNSIVDGDYFFRVEVANQDEQRYSNSLNVLVDRNVPQLMGLPRPLSDRLGNSDNIFLLFDENIDCSQIKNENFQLRNLSKGGALINADCGCFDNKLVFISSFEDVDSSNYLEFKVSHVSDLYGNINTDTISWGFEIGNVNEFISSEKDTDEDGIIDSEDNCLLIYNPDQQDTDEDGEGDVCDDDLDGDGIPNDVDNCPLFSNADQVDDNNNGIGDVCEVFDRDGDGIPNEEDNCPDVANPDQLDTDNDGIGDVCELADSDNDGIPDFEDNCPYVANADQKDADGDGIGDVCDEDIDGDGVNNDIDNCMYLANADQLDVDNNGVGDACENDSDGDGIPDATDNCPSTPNPDQADLDNDGIGDICDIDKDGDEMPNTYDNCPLTSNPLQLDMDNDGIGDICDDDIDGDGVLNDIDNCPTVANYDQTDTDEDGNGDVCDGDIDGDGIINNIDNCPYIANADQTDTNEDGNGDVCDGDIDGDGILNENDNCPTTANPDQADFDNDGEGDVCDFDTDNDGIEDDADNCIYIANPDQKDTDNDGVGDVCDDDIDDDTILNDEDNCPYVANADQSDIDGDGIGNACDDDIDGDLILNDEDNCPYVANADQTDANNNGLGDICENDADGDGILNENDNCPYFANSLQEDTDNDGEGDACDDDIDGDGVVNENDNCPLIANSDQSDNDNDGTGDACEVTAASDIQNKDKFRCIAFPNPFDNNVTLQINSSQQEELVLEVLDLTGRITYQKKVSVIIGENTFEIETKNWASGVYTYRLYGKENVVTNKIMKN